MPSEIDILDAWEHATGRQPCQRELLLLHLVSPELTGDLAMDLRIGQKNALLLTLRERIFGPDITGTEICPACGDRLEFQLKTRDIRVAEPGGTEECLSYRTPDYDITFRLPTCRDLVTPGPGPSRVLDCDTVFERCILTVISHGDSITSEKLPSEVVDDIVNQMREHDSQAEIRISLVCPACKHEWEAIFDIGLFLWEELNSWANRTLYDVHLLASAYGWTEEEILLISPLRRQYYLERVTE